jgi:hypothetical protein
MCRRNFEFEKKCSLLEFSSTIVLSGFLYFIQVDKFFSNTIQDLQETITGDVLLLYFYE